MSFAARRTDRHPGRLPAIVLGATILATLLGTSACSSPDEGGPEWFTLAFELDAALLGVWGRGDEVFVVGADDDSGSTWLRYDGLMWSRIETGSTGDLWWVFGLPSGSVWAVGEGGLILRYRDGLVTRVEAPIDPETGEPSDAHLFGVFPTSETDVWAVGGADSGRRGVMWRLEGDRFVDVALPDGVAERGPLFKVWGSSPNDLWAVGVGGVSIHRGPDGWRSVDTPRGRRLFTIHGAGDRAFAVGGFADGLLVEARDGELSDATPEGLPQLNGVWVTDDGGAVAVGVGGAVWRFDGEAWSEDTRAPATSLDWHSVYVDPGGDAWTVGGFIVSEPLNQGMIAWFGESPPRGFPDLQRVDEPVFIRSGSFQ